MGTTELQIVCKLITFPELDLGHVSEHIRNIFPGFKQNKQKIQHQ